MRHPFLPVAISTNNDSLEYKSAAVRAGADYFLSKKSNTINDLVLLAESIFLKKSEDKAKVNYTGKLGNGKMKKN